MRFALFAGIFLGLLLAAGPDLAQPRPEPVQAPHTILPDSQTSASAPGTDSPSAQSGEISHDEMVKEQERRDREVEEERDRDDQ
jgi:hypothetical protein